MTIKFSTVIGEKEVRVVNKYAHLGVSTSAGCAHAQEITARKQSCTAALGPIASKCFNHDGVELSKKIEITRSHLFSRLLFGAGGWHLLTKHEEQTLVTATMHVWRRTTQTTFQHRADKHSAL